MGQRMVGLFYLSRRALSQRTQLPNTASLIAYGMHGSITEFRGSVCAPGRNAYIAEGSAPVGAGA